MKKILLVIALGWIGLFNNNDLKAQCTISDLTIRLISAVPVGDSCLVTFHFGWTQEANLGNKFAYIHLWNVNEYPDLLASGLAYQPPSSEPDATDLVEAIATIVIEENGSANPFLGDTYYPDPSVQVLQSWPGLDTLKITKLPIDANHERMIVQNITLMLPDCDTSGIEGDIWASQAQNGLIVHCVSTDVSLVVGNPRITGFINCTEPRQYTTTISNIGPSPIRIWYEVYIDVDDDELFEPQSHDNIQLTADSVGPIDLAPGASFNTGIVQYFPDTNFNKGLWVQVFTQGYENSTIHLISNECAALPVTLSSFTARREGDMVLLQWQTQTEENNMGYEIQRSINGGGFVTVGWVASRAPGGNSTSPLTYTYQDLNPARGISEYRLKQIDFDREARLSEIRAVRGIDQEAEIMIYPNPSASGQVNILINDADNFYDVSLLDMNGRLIKKWNNYGMGHIRVTDLNTGVYAVRLTNTGTRETRTYKFVVSR